MLVKDWIFYCFKKTPEEILGVVGIILYILSIILWDNFYKYSEYTLKLCGLFVFSALFIMLFKHLKNSYIKFKEGASS